MFRRLRSLFACPPLYLLAMVVSSGVAGAADGDGAKAHTEPPQDDPSFVLQGEFVGPVAEGENDYRALGLQVRPLGGDRFEARQFAGGLPGQDNHQGDAVTLVGRRSGDFLVLSGGPWAVFVEKDHCLVVDRNGERVGRLERIQRSSPTLGAEPPEEATVLFDGNGTDQFTRAEITSDGLLKQGADFKPMVQDFDLHLEFRLPYMPGAGGQARGNSGVYLQSRYECQVLDSFAQEIQINGCGSLYRLKKPDVNMCLPPLVWQTYDIRFTAPRWAADGSKLRDAHVTVWLNGVKIHDNVAVPNKTGAGQPEAPSLLPTKLQNHKDPVRFRNVWLIDRGLNSTVEFPVQSNAEDAAPAESETQDEKSPQRDKKDAGDGDSQQPESTGGEATASDDQTSEQNASSEEDEEVQKDSEPDQSGETQQDEEGEDAEGSGQDSDDKE